MVDYLKTKKMPPTNPDTGAKLLTKASLETPEIPKLLHPWSSLVVETSKLPRKEGVLKGQATEP
jgi:hypothetical protein